MMNGWEKTRIGLRNTLAQNSVWRDQDHVMNELMTCLPHDKIRLPIRSANASQFLVLFVVQSSFPQ
jgi:hypothetical protein